MVNNKANHTGYVVQQLIVFTRNVIKTWYFANKADAIRFCISTLNADLSERYAYSFGKA